MYMCIVPGCYMYIPYTIRIFSLVLLHSSEKKKQLSDIRMPLGKFFILVDQCKIHPQFEQKQKNKTNQKTNRRSIEHIVYITVHFAQHTKQQHRQLMLKLQIQWSYINVMFLLVERAAFFWPIVVVIGETASRILPTVSIRMKEVKRMQRINMCMSVCARDFFNRFSGTSSGNTIRISSLACSGDDGNGVLTTNSSISATAPSYEWDTAAPKWMNETKTERKKHMIIIG